MKKNVKILLAVAITLVCTVGGAVYFLQPKTVEVQPASRGALEEQVVEQGKLKPKHSTAILADISGTIQTIHAPKGYTVAEGEPILQIDASMTKRELETQIASLKLQQTAIYAGNSGNQGELALRKEQLHSQLATIRQEYEMLFGKDGSGETLLSIAESRHSYARRLYRKADEYYGDLTDEMDDYEIGKSEISVLRNQMELARENLVIAKSKTSETTRRYYEDMIASCEAQIAAMASSDIHANNSASATAQQLQLTIDQLTDKLTKGSLGAPYTGMVLDVLVSEGDFVAENQPVAAVYGGEEMGIEVLLLSEDALALQAGDTVSCRYADGTVSDGLVQFVSPVAEEVVSTIGLTENRCRVEILPKTMPKGAGAGHKVELTFTFTVATDVLMVPASAVVPEAGGNAVYVIRDGKVRLVPIEAGLRRGGNVEVLSGLEEGEELVLSPYDSKVADGDRAVVA